MSNKYENQRAKRVAPHVSLATLRKVSGLNGPQVCSRVSDYLKRDKAFTPGALSAIENGLRGASVEVLAALEFAYGLEAGAIVTDYLPRNRDLTVAETA